MSSLLRGYNDALRNWRHGARADPFQTTAFHPDYVSWNSLSVHRNRRRAQPVFSATYMGPSTTTATKRRASRSPSERSAKRHAGSSPEEGEVADNGSPGQAPASSTPAPSQPPKAPNLPPKPRVAFPFKTKGGPSSARPTLPAFDSSSGPSSHVRAGETEERLAPRNNDSSWRTSRGDHWERRNGSPDRRRRPSPSRAAPRHDYHRSRSRSPPSRRSHSPSSPYHQEKHRLPPPRSPAGNFSPLSYNRGTYHRGDADDYDRRWPPHDTSRGYSRVEDERHYRPSNDYYPPRSDDHRSSGYKEWERDNYRDRGRDYNDRRRREEPYTRRPASSPPSHSMPPPPEPKSSGGPPPQPQTPPPPQPSPDSRLLAKDATLPEEHKTVSIALKRPPPTSQAGNSWPPPPQPIDALVSRKKDGDAKVDVVMVTEGETKYTEEERKREEDMKRERKREEEMKREEERKKETDRKRAEGWERPDDRKRDEERKREQGWKREDKKDAAPSKPRPILRRNIVRRTEEEEFKAYGRKFVGCGQQTDYDVTTKLGEGTFGEVHKAIHRKSRNVVALKRILMHNEKEGMPVTALREIKILKALNHPSIVDILDMFVVRSTAKDPLSVYMVFPYMDHDLAGLLENDRVKLTFSQIKLYMKQLLEGTEYMHRNHILHRDMKAANLLISNQGSLRIADFGLARSYDTNVTRTTKDGQVKERRYTNCVVTRWYRPPELLLGARQYGGEVDIWGIGCVFGEMFTKRPILAGNSDFDQLEKIWQLCGAPNQLTWPNFDALPGCDGVKRFAPHSRRVKQAFERHMIFPQPLDLLDKLLTCNPMDRITAADALDHDYFWTEPLPADPASLPSYEASHEFDKRGQRHQPPPMPAPQHPVHMPSYNIQNASRGHTGPDFHPNNAPGMIRNAHNYNNRHMPYPGPPPHGQPHHGPPHHGPPHHGPPGPHPPDFNADFRNRPNQPRYNQPGGGGRGPPYHHNPNNPQNRPRGQDWRDRPPPAPPAHLPPRPAVPQGVPPPRNEAGRGDSRPPPPAGNDAKLDYDD